jgi:hypothetical protein
MGLTPDKCIEDAKRCCIGAEEHHQSILELGCKGEESLPNLLKAPSSAAALDPRALKRDVSRRIPLSERTNALAQRQAKLLELQGMLRQIVDGGSIELRVVALPRCSLQDVGEKLAVGQADELNESGLESKMDVDNIRGINFLNLQTATTQQSENEERSRSISSCSTSTSSSFDETNDMCSSNASTMSFACSMNSLSPACSDVPYQSQLSSQSRLEEVLLPPDIQMKRGKSLCHLEEAPLPPDAPMERTNSSAINAAVWARLPVVRLPEPGQS